MRTRDRNNYLHRELKKFGVPAHHCAFADDFYITPEGFGDLFLLELQDIGGARKRINYNMGKVTPEKVKVFGKKSVRQAVVSVIEPKRTFYSCSMSREGRDHFPTRKLADFYNASYRDFIRDMSFDLFALAEQADIDAEGIIVRPVLEGHDSYHLEVDFPATEMTFLMGWDEDDMFISQLPKRVASVGAAHRLLRPVEISDRALRQGEWFFDPVVDPKVIEGLTRKYDSYSSADRRVGNDALDDHEISIIMCLGKHDYGMGYVTNDRHKTLYLPGWHRIVRNNEIENYGSLFD